MIFAVNSEAGISALMISDIIEALRLKSEGIVVIVNIAGFLTFMIFF